MCWWGFCGGGEGGGGSGGGGGGWGVFSRGEVNVKFKYV